MVLPLTIYDMTKMMYFNKFQTQIEERKNERKTWNLKRPDSVQNFFSYLQISNGLIINLPIWKHFEKVFD